MILNVFTHLNLLEFPANPKNMISLHTIYLNSNLLEAFCNKIP